jgi:hypothetical protein
LPLRFVFGCTRQIMALKGIDHRSYHWLVSWTENYASQIAQAKNHRK